MEKDEQEAADVVGEVERSGAEEQKCAGETNAGLQEGTKDNKAEVQKGPGGKKARAKHKCPVPACNSVVIHLPRHMHHKHGWSKKDASNVLNAFALRKERKVSGKRKRTFSPVMCPVLGCCSVVKRIHNHLTDKHKFERGSKKYKVVLARATPHVVQVISSESSANESCSTTENSDDSAWEKEMEQCLKRKKKCQKPMKKCQKLKKKCLKHPSIFERVYSSNEDESSENEGSIPKYPDIFKEELHTNDSEEDYEEDNEDKPGTSRDYKPPLSPSSLSHNSNVDEDSPEDKQDEVSNQESSSGDISEDVSDDDNDNDSLNNSPLESTVQTQVFEKFESWLQSADGGRKDERCAKQCSRQVQLVIQTIDPVTPKLSNILHKSILRDKWLNEFEKKKQPGTVKSYLGALNQFYFFLKSEHLPDVDATPESLTSLSEQMKLWSKSFRNLIKDRFWEKRMDDIAKLKTPKQVNDFDTSDVARQVIKLLGDFQESPPEKIPSHTEYTLVRDYLLTVVCINNGSRSGALANMTLGEFKQAQNDEGDFVVKVKKHKTFTTHGPAHLVFSSSIHEWMQIFITKFRNRLGDIRTDDKAPVFLTWNQRPFHSSHIGKQIGSCWGKVFGKDASAGGATAFRKAAVSAVQESNTELRGDLANLMVHNKATADHYYLLQEKSKSAVRTSRELTKIMHPGRGKSESRHSWTSEEEAALQDLFSSQIENQSISVEEVKKIYKQHPLLCEISVVKIYNKIRSLFKDEQEKMPSPPVEVESSKARFKRFGLRSEVGETRHGQEKRDDGTCNDDVGSEYSPSVISPSVSASAAGKGKLFTDEETAEFQKLFENLIQSKSTIARADVKSKIETSTKLKHLLKRYSVLQLADKVRTERKIFERHCK